MGADRYRLPRGSIETLLHCAEIEEEQSSAGAKTKKGHEGNQKRFL